MKSIKRNASKLFLICIFSLVTDLFSDDSFQYKTINSPWLKSIKVTYYKDAVKIGFACLVRIPCTGCSVIHSLYVYPEYRGHGYGTKILLKACNVLKDMGVQSIYIQPGPFERNMKSEQKTDSFCDEKTHRLVKLYRKCGFKITNQVLRKLAYILYRIVGIHENSQFLMVKRAK